MVNFLNKKDGNKNTIHAMLVYVYAVFFVSMVLGVLLDEILKLELLANFEHSYIGTGIIVFGTLLIYLAQKASFNASKIKPENSSVEGFMYGPYKYFRHPTYLGVFFMVLGFGIVIRSTFSVLLILITYLIVKLTFVKKEEKTLEEKYGQIYLDYKKKVRM